MMPIAHTTRNGRVESRHCGAIAIVRDDETLFTVGDVERPIFPRSTLKAIQLLPLLEDRLDDTWGLGAEELALMASSHDGAPRHVEIVARLLERTGFDISALRCGDVLPYDRHEAHALLRSGGRPSALHNDCSGKHVGFLLQARAAGVPLAAYLEPNNAVHRRIRATLAELAGLRADALPIAQDGCSAPAFALPLLDLARVYARIATPDTSTERGRGLERLMRAISEYPEAYAGDRRLSTALLRALPHRVFPKNGAEGVFALAVPELRIGVAIKVEDGADRGYFPVVTSLLQRLGVLNELPAELERFAAPRIETNAGATIGHVKCDVEWSVPI